MAVLLQSPPRALVQAGAYVSRGHCTLADHTYVYERQRQQLSVIRPSQTQSRYRDLYATFEVSGALHTTSRTERSRDALQLLSLPGVGASSRLPLPLFEAGWQGARRVPPDVDEAEDDNVLLVTPWHVAHMLSPSDTDGDTWDSLRLVKAMSLVNAYYLVSTDSYDSSLSVSMHLLFDRGHEIGKILQGNIRIGSRWGV